MEEAFDSGLVVNLIIALVIIEATLLCAYHGRTGRGIRPLDLLPNLMAGGALLLALRATLAGASWHWTAVALLAALTAHVLDLVRRWR